MKNTVTILILLMSSLLNAQTGPGGVGNSSNNNLWLRADAGTFIDAGVTPADNTNQIQQWNDQSGNSKNAILHFLSLKTRLSSIFLNVSLNLFDSEKVNYILQIFSKTQ